MALLKKKVSVSEVMRKYGMPDSYIKAGKALLRYTQPLEKGIYWYWLSQFVRLRDYIKWGTCISCDKQCGIEEMNAGHYAAAGGCGFALLFDPSNLNGECPRCNAWDDSHLIGYERGYIARYGQQAMDELKQRYFDRHKTTQEAWGVQEYEENIIKVRANVNTLSTVLRKDGLDAARQVLKSM